MSDHPVRRCAPCNLNWPGHSEYNLCPRCQRCTFATTDVDHPNAKEAKAERERYERIREFDAECDAAAQATTAQWIADMDVLLQTTPDIPDPAGAAGLPALHVLEADPNAQRIDYWDGRGDA